MASVGLTRPLILNHTIRICDNSDKNVCQYDDNSKHVQAEEENSPLVTLKIVVVDFA